MADNWTQEELNAAVAAYTEMRRLEIQGKPFNKSQYYKELAQKYGRSQKAFEYRMQNISHIYSLQGRQWLKGLKPAKNVGAHVTGKLEEIIAKHENIDTGDMAKYAAEVAEKRVKLKEAPPGNNQPDKKPATVTVYGRSPEVAAWVLDNAGACCEACDKPAPFVKDDGTLFLEVHHLIRLADGGPDTTSNTLALCPNCHRQLHYGKDRVAIAEDLYEKIPRLKR